VWNWYWSAKEKLEHESEFDQSECKYLQMHIRPGQGKGKVAHVPR